VKFRPKREIATEGYRKLQNLELHHLYSLPDTIRTITSRRNGSTGHVIHMGEKRNAYKF
jgi:hypothetical protein